MLTHELGCLFLDGLGVSFGAVHQDHEIVRVADHSMAGQALGSVTHTVSWCARVPGCLEVTVEYQKSDVRQQRREDRSLWCARWRGGEGAKLTHDTSAKELSYQCEYCDWSHRCGSGRAVAWVGWVYGWLIIDGSIRARALRSKY